MPPTIFTGHNAGDILPAADWQNNWTLVETSFNDIGPFVISGMVPSAGSGLSVNVTSGNARFGADVAFVSATIPSLTNTTVNHLYALSNGTLTSNTTGTAPANSVKLGTATTAGGVVTSVDTNRSSGRQVWVRPELRVPGGPGAGNPGSIDLSQWNTTAGNGFTVYGSLPSGAVGGMTPPISYALNDANQNSVQTTLTISHTYNAGGGANGIGVALDMVAESATNGTNKTAVSLQATLVDATAATATGRLSIQTIANNAQVIPLTVAGQDIRIPQATAASAQHGLLNIGSGGFDGSAGHFSGDTPGTLLAMNAPSGYTGAYINIQKNSTILCYLDGNGTLFRLSAPVTTANDGQLSLGPDFAHFDGSSTGHFVGSSSGQYLAINAESGFAGNLADWAVHGTRKFAVSSAGTVTLADAANLIVGSTTGTQLATATTQKLGFWGKTPVVRPAAYTVTNATTNRSLDETAATLGQLAQVVGTLLTDLQSTGIIG